MFRNPVKCRMPRARGSMLFRPLDLFPIRPDFIHAGHFCISKNVRMPANELFNEDAADAFKIKGAAFMRELAMKDHLQQQIPQLLRHFMVIVRFDGINQFVHFFNRMTAKAEVGLFAVPGTAGWRTQLRHYFEQMFNRGGLFHGEFLKNHQIVAVHQFHAGRFFLPDFIGAKLCNAAREFHSVQVANTHDITRVKVALASRHAWWQ